MARRPRRTDAHAKVAVLQDLNENDSEINSSINHDISDYSSDSEPQPE
jgi:hypothetical protein